MDITPLIPEGKQVIDGYGDGGFRITRERYHGPVLITPNRTYSWDIPDIADIALDNLLILKEQEPGLELLLIGCGHSIHPAPLQLRQSLRDWGMVIEPMPTGAACRTYNVLIAEGRPVGAALIPV